MLATLDRSVKVAPGVANHVTGRDPAPTPLPGRPAHRRRGPHRGFAPSPSEPPLVGLPVLSRRCRGSRALPGPLVPQPLAVHARRRVRGGALLPRPRRLVRRRWASSRPRRWSTCGRSAPRRSGADPDSTTCWCSRTAGPRWGPPSPIPTARSTGSTWCRRGPGPSWSDRRRRTALGPGAPGDREVSRSGPWRAWVPWAAGWPYSLLVAPERPVPDLPSLDADGRRHLATVLVDALGRLDRLFDGADALHVVVPPAALRRWRLARCLGARPRRSPAGAAPATPRFVASGELGSGILFNPVDPDDAADARCAAPD